MMSSFESMMFTWSSSMVQSVSSVLSLVLEGARTNLFGFGCPLYCFQTSGSTSALIFILGFLSGLFCTCLALWDLWTRFGHLTNPATQDPSRAPVSSRYSALAGHLNERSGSRRRGH